jgi:hypothetical protein
MRPVNVPSAHYLLAKLSGMWGSEGFLPLEHHDSFSLPPPQIIGNPSG